MASVAQADPQPSGDTAKQVAAASDPAPAGAATFARWPDPLPPPAPSPRAETTMGNGFAQERASPEPPMTMAAATTAPAPAGPASRQPSEPRASAVTAAPEAPQAISLATVLFGFGGALLAAGLAAPLISKLTEARRRRSYLDRRAQRMVSARPAPAAGRSQAPRTRPDTQRIAPPRDITRVLASGAPLMGGDRRHADETA